MPAEDFWDRPAGTAGTTLAAYMGAVLKGQDLEHGAMGIHAAVEMQLPALMQSNGLLEQLSPCLLPFLQLKLAEFPLRLSC